MDNELLNKLWLLIQRKKEPFIKVNKDIRTMVPETTHWLPTREYAVEVCKQTKNFMACNPTDEQVETFYVNYVLPHDKRSISEILLIKMYVCSECRSDRIREAVMVDYNTREEIRNVFNPADIWCDVCDCETNAVRKVSNGN